VRVREHRARARRTTGLEPQSFVDTGFTLAVLEPGKPTGMYHAESGQEDFLVLAGTCFLLVEEQERPLRAWDFVHCPAGTRHTFVGTGDQPCVIETETDSPAEAYAPFAHCRLGRPDAWADLPWSG
jgi:uncharacterized cupin superfamily protein